MNKIILKDSTEFEINEGVSLGEIVAIVSDFTALGTVADALAVPGNLDTVKFATGEAVTGVYDNMTMDAPLFKSVDVCGMVRATFAIRHKTDTEMRLDALENGQAVQDGAIGDLGTVVSEIAEGGTV